MRPMKDRIFELKTEQSVVTMAVNEHIEKIKARMSELSNYFAKAKAILEAE